MAASSNKHPEIPNYSTKSKNFGVKPYVLRVKEFIKMVNEVVEGLIDNKSKMTAVSKEKIAKLSYYPHYSDYCVVKCYVFGIKEFIKMINQVVEGLNDTKIQNIRHFKQLCDLPVQSIDFRTKTHVFGAVSTI
jgi:hypothetical protein